MEGEMLGSDFAAGVATPKRQGVDRNKLFQSRLPPK
jgi:hypothetical protein